MVSQMLKIHIEVTGAQGSGKSLAFKLIRGALAALDVLKKPYTVEFVSNATVVGEITADSTGRKPVDWFEDE